MAPLIPQRIVAAVDLLGLQPHDFVLEIGCGNGTAATLVCERLAEGQLVAIDRSETQIRLARERNRAHIEAGRATFYVMALEAGALPDKQFDKVFAINVNCFWLRYERPLAAVKRLLKPHGVFHIFYQHPTTEKMREVSLALQGNLTQMGFAIQRETTTGPVYCLASTVSPP